jgi:hypothetical protein
MDLLGEQAGEGNTQAMAALKSLIFAPYGAGHAARALGTAAVKNEEALNMLLQPEANGLLLSSAVDALEKPAAAGNAKAVAFLINVLEDPNAEPLSELALDGLTAAAAKGNAEAKAAIHRYTQGHKR